MRRRLSRYGVLHWTSQRLTESLVTNYGTIVGGTWALNFMYRLLGAKIGRLSIIRSKAPGIATPEMLTMGDKCVLLSQHWQWQCVRVSQKPMPSQET